MVTVDDVRELVRDLPRSYEVLVRDRVKFRVGQIVYLSFSPDERTMGFAFPKDERDALISAEPEKFLPPAPADERFNWLEVRLAALGPDELREIVLDAWRMVVPKRISVQQYRFTMTAASVPVDRIVDPEYRHVDKTAEPVAPAAGLPGLKWYEIRAPEGLVSEAARNQARALITPGAEYSSDDLGFVLLHLCGESFYFLLVGRWRGNNELWETVYTKSGDADFELLQGGATRPTFCVWELGVVFHEQQAWMRYLRGARDEPSRAGYLADYFSGPV